MRNRGTIEVSRSDCEYKEMGVVGWDQKGDFWLHMVDPRGNSDNLYLSEAQVTKFVALLSEQLKSAAVASW